jgi:hypothetical protein
MQSRFCGEKKSGKAISVIDFHAGDTLQLHGSLLTLGFDFGKCRLG